MCSPSPLWSTSARGARSFSCLSSCPLARTPLPPSVELSPMLSFFSVCSKSTISPNLLSVLLLFSDISYPSAFNRTSRGLNIFWGVRSKLNRKCFFYANHTAGLARLVALFLTPPHPPQHKPVNSVAEAPVNHERLFPGACNARAGWNLILQNGARQKQAAVQCTARRLAAGRLTGRPFVRNSVFSFLLLLPTAATSRCERDIG